MVRRFLALLSAALLGLIGVALGVVPAQAASDARVSVLHAVPGATVDVYVNGDRLLKNFKPGTLTDPQRLPAGSYDLKVVKAGDGASGDAIVEANNVKVPGGANITVVAHLDKDGDPALTPYVNDVSEVPAGKARITVRHTAAAPEVDVRAGGEPVFTNLSSPEEDSAEVGAGTIKADVVLAGTDTVAIGPASLKLGEGTSTIVYAWGSADDDNLKLAVQSISGLHGNPSGVPGGDGGQAAAMSPAGLGLAALAVLGIVVGGLQLIRRRATSIS
jgi:Domain of unknown function (DUF4397)